MLNGSERFRNRSKFKLKKAMGLLLLKLFAE